MKKLWKIYDLSLIFIVVALLLSAVTLYFDRNLAIIEAVVIFAFAIGKFFYHKAKKEKLIYKVKTVSSELDFSEGKAFERLSVPCVVIEEDGNIIWLNDSFKNAMNIDEKSAVSNIKDIVRRDNIDKLIIGCGFRIKVENLYFSVYSSEIDLKDEKIYLLYFFDETKLRLTEKEFYDTRPSVMISVIDNADEIYQNFKESECAAIFSKIEQMIDDWATSYGALCRKFSNARMLIFVEERSLQRMIVDKFSILDKVRDYSYDGKNTDITLSVGVGKDDSLIEANNSARQALDMAQSRGGDQVAIKTNKNDFEFFGGVAKGIEKRISGAFSNFTNLPLTSKIEILSEPTKKTYIQNYETLDLAGGILTVTYNDGTALANNHKLAANSTEKYKVKVLKIKKIYVIIIIC